MRWVAASAGAGAVVAAGIWWLFLGVSFCPAGVVVRNMTTSWYVPWPQAMGFQLDRQGVWLVTAGGPIRCQAFPRLPIPSRRNPIAENFFLYPLLDRLQDEVHFEDIGIPDGARACPVDGHNPFAAFDRADARFLDDVQAWPSVEPAIDFTSTGSSRSPSPAGR